MFILNAIQMISRGVERVIETNGEYSFELMIDPESIRD
jgi:hypothetical protein